LRFCLKMPVRDNRRAGCNLCARAVLLFSELIPEAQILDDLPVIVDIRALQVIEKAAALSDHLEEPTPPMMILLVGAKVVRQIIDALREQRDLNASRSTVRLMRPVLLDGQALFESHVLVILVIPGPFWAAY
jgi:hypothetical protein